MLMRLKCKSHTAVLSLASMRSLTLHFIKPQVISESEVPDLKIMSIVIGLAGKCPSRLHCNPDLLKPASDYSFCKTACGAHSKVYTFQNVLLLPQSEEWNTTLELQAKQDSKCQHGRSSICQLCPGCEPACTPHTIA